MVLGFIALHREARVRTIVITGDVIIFQAQEIKGKPKANIFGAAHTETRARNFCAFTKSEGFLMPGGRSERIYETVTPCTPVMNPNLPISTRRAGSLIWCWKRAPVK